jgi:hypothetical protein
VRVLFEIVKLPGRRRARGVPQKNLMSPECTDRWQHRPKR